MKPIDYVNIPKITRTAIRELPKSWKSLNKTFLQKITKKKVFQLNAIAVVVGVLTGYAALGFRYLIGFFQNAFLFNQNDFNLIAPMDHTRGYWIFLILPLGLLASTLITHFFAKEAKGHGVPEVIEAVMTRGGRIRTRVVALKALASSITIASGGSVGREGPIVQIGSATGSALGQWFHLEPKLMKTLVGCGAAGAVAATFNTPIAGVIFAIEVIVLELKTRSFVPLVVSSVFATAISRLYVGNEPAFFVPEYSLSGIKELFFYLILGILSGVVGVFVIKVVYGFEDFFDNLKVKFWMKPLIGGVILAAISIVYPQMLGVGYETVTEVLQQNSELSLMFVFIFLKIFCTSLTLAAGGSGGVFAPSLFIGAMLGGSFGHVIHNIFPDITVGYGAYALVGMAAMFSATGRATFTAIVILFEMTLDYSIILPLMLVCVTADQVALALSKESIYSMKLKRKGLEFVNDISINVMGITLVRDIMTTELHAALETMSVKEVASRLLKYGHTAFPVTDAEGLLTGMVTKELLEEGCEKDPEQEVKFIQIQPLAVVRSDDTVLRALTKIDKTRDPRILVTDPKTKKLVGIVSPVDFVRLSSADVDT